MGSGDWSTDLGLGNQIPDDLAPASAVRAGESHTSNQDASSAARRRARQKEKMEEDLDQSPSSEPGEQPEHRLDHLA
jgi:hypothetical protein